MSDVVASENAVVATQADILAAMAETGVSKYADDAAFNEVATTSGFLPRLSLMNSTSEQVKMDKMKQGYYALVKSADDCIDMTKEVNCIPFAWRPKALNMKNKKKVIAAYNPKSKLFEEIAAMSQTSGSNCMYGPEYLIYIPHIQTWATFHMASKTARRTAGEVKERLEKREAMTLKSTFIKQDANSWWGPLVTTCSAPLQWPTDVEEIKAQIRKFNAVPESEDVTDPAPAEAVGAAARPR